MLTSSQLNLPRRTKNKKLQNYKQKSELHRRNVVVVLLYGLVCTRFYNAVGTSKVA